ncbi:MAG: hypothetical protein KIT23_03595 [Sphingopyxis sp.]|nr:hypothetical protein [Sphingopyxis sp.]
MKLSMPITVSPRSSKRAAVGMPLNSAIPVTTVLIDQALVPSMVAVPCAMRPRPPIRSVTKSFIPNAFGTPGFSASNRYRTTNFENSE